MSSFPGIRDLLLVAYDNGALSDEEFLVLWEDYRSKNPYFPYDYERFDLETMNEDECIAEFRMRKQDIPIVVDALQLPATIQCSQRTICDADEALYLTHQKQKSKTSKNIIIPKDFFLG
ncbi:predicted protein [Nematostella vectensis]|uniref:Uncharacterized protein n=1 Tax=Nematostella vectensis TaxID=45351 RepID=A7S121_NEMVE|nr:predicted protein [Nematostella vectensis]|eukprot:XP_001634579.1 predicted protein [Nematostella vectensis]